MTDEVEYTADLAAEETAMSMEDVEGDDELDMMIAAGSRIKQVKAKLLANRKPLLCIGCLLTCAVLVLVSAGVSTGLAVSLTLQSSPPPVPEGQDYVLYYGDEEPFSRDGPDKEMIVTTREYQVKLFTSKFRNRDAGVEEMLSFLEPFLGVSLRSSGNLTIWREFHYKSGKCGSTYSELRSRDVLMSSFPAFVNTTVFTLKENTGKNGAGDASMGLYLPSDAFARGSVQKVEEDVHPCKHKFSRKSMVVSNIEFGAKLETCQQLHSIYPYAFQKQSDDSKKVTIHSTSYWWVKSIEGFLPKTAGWAETHFKIAFTLIYDDEEAARIGNVEPHGETEWSIRLWSSDDGHSTWEESVLNNMADTYIGVLERFGTDESSYPCSD